MSEIDKLLNKAAKLHFDGVVAKAKKLMLQHKNISCFCMAMGSASFHDKNGPMWDDLKYLQPFYNYLYRYNDALKTTGDPVKIERVNDQLITKTDW